MEKVIVEIPRLDGLGQDALNKTVSNLPQRILCSETDKVEQTGR